MLRSGRAPRRKFRGASAGLFGEEVLAGLGCQINWGRAGRTAQRGGGTTGRGAFKEPPRPGAVPPPTQISRAGVGRSRTRGIRPGGASALRKKGSNPRLPTRRPRPRVPLAPVQVPFKSRSSRERSSWFSEGVVVALGLPCTSKPNRPETAGCGLDRGVGRQVRARARRRRAARGAGDERRGECCAPPTRLRPRARPFLPRRPPPRRRTPPIHLSPREDGPGGSDRDGRWRGRAANRARDAEVLPRGGACLDPPPPRPPPRPPAAELAGA